MHHLRFSREYLHLFGHGETAAETSPAYSPAKFTENLLQLIWRNSLYDQGALTLTGGQPVTVHTPGRFNTGPGPDFKNASISIGGRLMHGDIEIHKHSREWYEHKHHLSPLYDNTVLHVVMERGENTPPPRTRKGRIVPELEVGLYMRHPVEELHEEIAAARSPLTGRPFNPPCTGHLKRLGENGAPNLFNFIGDGRVLIKSNRVIARLARQQPEQVLYELFAETLGYSRFNRQCGTLARAVPLETLRAAAAENPDLSPAIAAQAALFTAAGFVADARPGDEEGIKHTALLRSVHLTAIAPLFAASDWPLSQCRPANYPQRRIAALAAIAARGMPVALLREQFAQLPLDAGEARTRAFTRAFLDTFTGISDPFWDRRYNFAKAARSTKKLIGKDKAISIAVDCIIPFLLALARAENDLDLEQRLVLFYHSLPLPSSSAVLDFMRRAVLARDGVFAPRSVCHQQGLLQLYKDFCHAAPAACKGCAFVEYLRPLAAQPPA